MRGLRGILISFSVLLFSVSVFAGAHIVMDAEEVSFKTKEDCTNGITISGSNKGCCAGYIKSASFKNNSLKTEGLSLPVMVGPGSSFSFKVICNEKCSPADTLVLDLNGQKVETVIKCATKATCDKKSCTKK